MRSTHTGGTTRRERAERADSRERARYEARFEAQAATQDFEEKVQQWVSRLLATEKQRRDIAYDFFSDPASMGSHIGQT